MNLPDMNESPPPLPEIVEQQRYTSPQRDVVLDGIVFMDCHFDRVEWMNCRLSNLRFVNCTFDANRFERCSWLAVAHDSCAVRAGSWTHCELERVSYSECEIVDGAWTAGSLRDSAVANSKCVDWKFDDMHGAHFSLVASHLNGLCLTGGHWSDTSWIDSQLTDTRIENARLDNFIIGQSTTARTFLSGCHGINVRWIASRIEGLALDRCNLRQAAWSHCKWASGEIHQSQLALASFDCATLDRVRVTHSDLTQSIFDDARIVDCEFANLHAPRIALRDAQLTRVNLAGALLPQIDARGVLLESVSLHGADCRGGNLMGQSRIAWSAADTSSANFDDAIGADEQLWRHRNQPGARNYDNEC
ncbi:hypothetical protein WK39_22260 [Burkholderia cepacia]|uniref:pentapeptide repeat-containing protein n=1 Tax=Burkholderia cepacia TaxID=292 RepID=UPI0007584D2A|nr:pentapeptide repeat-containing protein [Burkholderia cepacia]KVS54938.1 hypothetical protein WK39_22260 [Burkholderia cepacia]KVS74519.1 hypothetical protein WK40_36790 [Burkholderia cepacia]RQT71089.1 hypothetical protein DF023_38140 [Burkholderia cepacia]RQT91815.1 hypothetical protein DF022_38175 [Burkholderia cepacia]RQZ67682.1 hypothetical protein DF056_38390 [Burkholderia cepacia]